MDHFTFTFNAVLKKNCYCILDHHELTKVTNSEKLENKLDVTTESTFGHSLMILLKVLLTTV